MPDLLQKYRKMRDFGETPEPAGGKPKRGKLPIFVIQKHQASHLHYDFRLEMEGVLKSWAVPKGPSYDPSVKRLAMMTEDHPYDYAKFEGVIPAGQYGGGNVIIWDEGQWEFIEPGDDPVKAIRAGKLTFKLYGKKMFGEWALVKIGGRSRSDKGNEWLLLKKKDASSQPGWNTEDHAVSVLTGRTQEEIAQGLDKKPAKKTGKQTVNLPEIGTPMLAQIGKGEPPSGDHWIYEVKWDGVRAICYIQDGQVRMVSRNGNVIDRQYPELSILPHHIKAETAILDGEIAALNERGVQFRAAAASHQCLGCQFCGTPLQASSGGVLCFRSPVS